MAGEARSMTRDEAKSVLGVVDSAGANDAYRILARVCHPDGPTPDPVKWAQLAEAIAVMRAPPPKCGACKGEGKLTIGRIKVWCSACGGRGIGD